MEQQTQAYKIYTKIGLNNWHYIDRKVLSLNESINFFTGHSGSGKSTVIDAMQIVLYANTDGRGFFNKAAADDSDRSLIEYLRGMINIGENNQISYRRNRNFSSNIVLEMEQSAKKEKECIGVVFDVDTSNHEIGRLFFWHICRSIFPKRSTFIHPITSASAETSTTSTWAAWIWRNSRVCSNGRFPSA